MLVGIVKSLSQGNYKEALKQGGSRIFTLDNNLNDETNYLLEEIKKEDSEVTTYNSIFHLSYSLSILFMFFFIGIILYKFGNWIVGKEAFNPFVDIILIVLIIVFFLTIEFLYTLLILDKTILPFTGVWYFIKNLPLIIKGVFV